MTTKTLILALTATAGVALTGVPAGAQTISSGAFTAGLNSYGDVYNAGVGFRRNADGFDLISPGIPRDSWGVSTNLGSAYADQNYVYGVTNITSSSAYYFPSSGPVFAQTISVTNAADTGLNVTQTFYFIQANILADFVTLTNVSGKTLTNVQFQRNVDFDVAPTQFIENSFTTASPAGTGVIQSSNYGFENPDPAVAYTQSCMSGCNTIDDGGAGIKVALGALDIGGSRSFTYFYGVTRVGETVDGLIADVQADDARYWVASQSSENGAYPNLGVNSAILAVVAVPEPSTWAMLGLGVAGLGFASSRGRMGRTSLAFVD